ncbi:MAG TPA: hypothetical protein DCR55_02305 [Lentisphaeria bacterium]|nr:hypothetical protein [Lentisphaeria bacterium]
MTHPHFPHAPLVLLLALLTFAATANSGFTIHSAKIAGRTYVYVADVARYYGFQAGMRGETAVLRNDQRTIEFTNNSRKAYFDGVLVTLMFAPRMHKGTLTLSHQDFRYFVDPVLRPWGIGKKPVRRIVLDVGHGGQDDGAKGTKLLEKNINLMLARRVKSMLEQYRYEVLLTRKDDSFPSLDARTKMAKAKGADLFISIHNNSATVKTVNGIETFLVTPQYGASIHKNDVEKTKVAGNANDAYNGLLAYSIHRRLISYTKANDRGVKYRRFKVLRDAHCPAVLLETGFLSNRKEEALLANEGYQNKLARAITHGIVEFHRGITVGPGE